MSKLTREFQDTETMSNFLRECDAGNFPMEETRQRECADSIVRALQGKSVVMADLALQVTERIIFQEGAVPAVRSQVNDAYFKGLEKHPEHLTACLARLLTPGGDRLVTSLKEIMAMTVSNLAEHVLDYGKPAVRNKVAEDIVHLCVKPRPDRGYELSMLPPLKGDSLLQLVMLHAREGNIDPGKWTPEGQELYWIQNILKALPPAPSAPLPPAP